MYFKTANTLLAGVNNGLGATSFTYDDKRNILSLYLKHNIYAFSAAKSLTEMLHFRDAMIDSKGNVLSFDAFRSRIATEGKVFNNAYLKTEYDTAYQSAIMAHKWDSLQADFLEYNTVGDYKVRDEHKVLDKITLPKESPVWHRMYPPNGWNCRCTVIPGLKQHVKLTESEVGKLAKQAIKSPIFDNNVGLSKVIFKDNHPFFIKASGKVSQLSWENYGLPSLAKIQINNLPTWTEKTLPEYLTWWDKEANYNNKEIVLQDDLGNSILFDEKFKQHINDKEERFKYATELKSIITDADEVWGNIDSKNGQVNVFYIKYYEKKPIAINVRNNIAKSMYEIDTEKKLNEIRRGNLMIKK